MKNNHVVKSLINKHNYIRLYDNEVAYFRELIKETTLCDEKFRSRKSKPGMRVVYATSGIFRGEKYRDWKKTVGKIYSMR